MADEIDLTPFCAKVKPLGSLYTMDEPFVHDGWRYATDGAVMIRVPAVGVPDSHGHRPPGSAQAWPTSRPAGMLPWPAGVYHWQEQATEHEDEDGDPIWAWAPSQASQPLGQQTIGSTYHYLVSRLPNATYAPSASVKHPIYVAFVGGEALLMPVKSLAAGDVVDVGDRALSPAST